ncbi:farnesyl pyrophosphate synthetase [Thraustotheca clavata]|uniref:Farnesyl pyrophosphate synthetase n=1 Tax=Thraustotheca clavata TaxID=74557 RepID=A0A1W0A180_9STRA|nr:farnesyl pyrophosphate synthetase [Thraustotheca clavata]
MDEEEDEEVEQNVSFKERLWEYLFRNVHRAVDELYCMCELESLPTRCEEAARVLQGCQEDFIKLMELIQMQTKSSTQKQKSLAWEVKKGSNTDKPTVAKALEHMAKQTNQSSLAISTGDEHGTDSLTPTPSPKPKHHLKLSLPRKPKRSPSETKLLSEQRLDTVNANKHAIESARLSRIRLAAERMQHVTSRNASSRKKQEQRMWAKLDRADRLKEAHLRWIVRKAGLENTKVDEINFIQNMMHQDRKIELQQRLEHVASRRENVLDEIKKKASSKAESIRAAAKAKEASLTKKLHEIQRRHEGVMARRLSYQQAKKEPSRGSATPRKHETMEQHLVSLEASMERTMNKNAQRLRDRIKSQTKSKYQDPFKFPRNSPVALSNQLENLLQQLGEMNLARVTMDKSLMELGRFVQSKLPTPEGELVVHLFRKYQGLSILVRALVQMQRAATLPNPQESHCSYTETMGQGLMLLITVCSGIRINIEYLMAENLVLPVVDILRWALCDESDSRQPVLLWAFPAVAMSLTCPSSPKMETLRQDLIRYILNIGLFFRIIDKFGHATLYQHGQVLDGEENETFRLLVSCVHFLTTLTTTYTKTIAVSMADLRLPLAKLFRSTGLIGIVSSLLSWFPIHVFYDCNNAASTGPIKPCYVSFATLLLHALNNIARLDLVWFQSTLGSPHNQPPFLHLVSSVLTKYALQHSSDLDDLMLQLLTLVGLYALQHPSHQQTLRWGHINTIQRLTNLPFIFFCDSRYKDALFPTLVAICVGDDENMTILERDVSSTLLAAYVRKLQTLQTATEARAEQQRHVQTEAWFSVAERFPVELWELMLAMSKQAEIDGTCVSREETSKENVEFIKVCYELKEEILATMKNKYSMPEEALQWVNEMVDYNCIGGKLNRGISVIHCAEALAQGPLTPEARKKAAILGWCIEWLQAFFLVADDVMDESITRRGQPCWYRIPKVKQIAINDAFLLESFVYQILKTHFRSESYYLDLVETFQEVIWQTELGQLLDLTSQPLDGPTNLDRFTIERHQKIVVFKTAYYTFYLSAASAMFLSGVKDPASYKLAQEICVKIGEYFQVQDDYLDCYADPKVLGKIGTDIQDNKCSWLVVQALSRATPEQRAVIKEHYGKNNEASIAIIKKLYVTLDLESVYRKYENDSYDELCKLIADVKNMPATVFHMLLSKIYKRKM